MGQGKLWFYNTSITELTKPDIISISEASQKCDIQLKQVRKFFTDWNIYLTHLPRITVRVQNISVGSLKSDAKVSFIHVAAMFD